MADFHDAIRRAATIVGGQAKLARLVGCAQSEVSRLCTTAAAVSPKMAIAISRVTGGQVRISDLLPDVVEAVAEELASRPSPAEEAV